MTIEAIYNGHKYSEVCATYGIPRSNLRDHIMGKTKSRKIGPKRVLTKEEELAFCDYIGDMTECGLSMTSTQVKLKMAQMIEDRITTFNP